MNRREVQVERALDTRRRQAEALVLCEQEGHWYTEGDAKCSRGCGTANPWLDVVGPLDDATVEHPWLLTPAEATLEDGTVELTAE